MKYEWKISLFAGLAERFGTRMIRQEWAENQLTALQIKQRLCESYPDQADLLMICFMAHQHTYADDGTLLSNDEELALLPPVSGGDSAADAAMLPSEERYRITDQPIRTEDALALVSHPDHGAAIAFVGTTREWTRGTRTVTLSYEAYTPMAISAMARIGDEITERWPGTLCAIIHRIGVVGINEISVVIAVSSPHRAEAYEASRYAIERLKQQVPIWKKEIYEDGSEWKGHQTGPWNPLAPIEGQE